MRIIHTNGFHIDERRQIKAVIYSNMIIAFRVLLEIMQTEDIDFAEEKTKAYADLLEETEADLEADVAFTDLDVKKAMSGMWLDKGVQQAVAKGHEYALNDNLSL
jgi:guanine nucleotide-binding protein subunit alpha